MIQKKINYYTLDFKGNHHAFVEFFSTNEPWKRMEKRRRIPMEASSQEE